MELTVQNLPVVQTRGLQGTQGGLQPSPFHRQKLELHPGVKRPNITKRQSQEGAAHCCLRALVATLR